MFVYKPYADNVNAFVEGFTLAGRGYKLLVFVLVPNTSAFRAASRVACAFLFALAFSLNSALCASP